MIYSKNSGLKIESLIIVFILSGTMSFPLAMLYIATPLTMCGFLGPILIFSITATCALFSMRKNFKGLDKLVNNFKKGHSLRQKKKNLLERALSINEKKIGMSCMFVSTFVAVILLNISIDSTESTPRQVFWFFLFSCILLSGAMGFLKLPQHLQQESITSLSFSAGSRELRDYKLFFQICSVGFVLSLFGGFVSVRFIFFINIVLMTSLSLFYVIKTGGHLKSCNLPISKKFCSIAMRAPSPLVCLFLLFLLFFYDAFDNSLNSIFALFFFATTLSAISSIKQAKDHLRQFPELECYA